jgi:hypothetical protein
MIGVPSVIDQQENGKLAVVPNLGNEAANDRVGDLDRTQLVGTASYGSARRRCA